jgi:sodium/hydrogen exchanger-like protein 6/7
MFITSTLLGIIGGLLSAIFLKKLKYFKLNRVQECSIIIFFAFLTYSCVEILEYSPIISLLFCGITMSHYSFYNLSFQAREESSIVSKIMSNIAEAFVFTYLGLTSVSISASSINLNFIVCMLIFVTFGRYFSIYGLSFVLEYIYLFYFRYFEVQFFKLTQKEKGIMAFAGSIRGAIAFGLAISIDASNSKHRFLLNLKFFNILKKEIFLCQLL